MSQTVEEEICNVSGRDIPEQFILEPLHQKEYLYDGQMISWDGPVVDVYSPVFRNIDGKNERILIGSYPHFTEKEALLAVESCKRAYENGRGEWPTMSVKKRLKRFSRFIEMMKEQRELVVKLMMYEIGKNYVDSCKEFDRTVDYISDTCKSLRDLQRQGSTFHSEDGIYAQIRRAPLGVVLSMGPFNYPLNETYTTLIPALIMGNCVLFKPPKHGCLTHQPMLKAFKECFPAGTVNTVYGQGSKIVPPLMSQGMIDVMAFIGTAKVANGMKKLHPMPHRLRCVLGLEAKNPAVILEDADLDLAVKECILGSFSYNGQRCTAIKIIFVHKNITEEFNKKFCEAVDNLQVGMPWDNAYITPLPENGKTGSLNDYVNDAISKGGKIINKVGGRHGSSIYFPTVIYPANDKMRLYHEEQFGPVIPIISFEKDEVVDYVIQSKYGQQISIFSRSAKKIAKMIDPFTNQVCRVNINCQCQRGPDVFPFTGRKDSAEGTLSVSDALRVFSIRTLVAAKQNDINNQILENITKNQLSSFLTTNYLF